MAGVATARPGEGAGPLLRWTGLALASLSAHAILVLILAQALLTPSRKWIPSEIPVEFVPSIEAVAPPAAAVTPSTQPSPHQATRSQTQATAQSGEQAAGSIDLWPSICAGFDEETRKRLGMKDCNPDAQAMTHDGAGIVAARQGVATLARRYGWANTFSAPLSLAFRGHFAGEFSYYVGLTKREGPAQDAISSLHDDLDRWAVITARRKADK